MSVRVAVIGAGCAGLAMGRTLVNEPKIEYIVYEKTKHIGGLWAYTKNEKQNMDHTALYKNLSTNLPKEVMGYPDLPFPECDRSFVHHEVVLDYLKSYVDHFGLDKKIKLKHEVQSVKPIHNKSGITWKVMVKDMINEREYIEIFEAVVVCSGHFSEPNIPDIPGMENFPGIAMHSIAYDTPDQFKDKIVVILGGKTSALDISFDVYKFAKKIYLVHRGKMGEIPENVEEIFGTITRAFSDGFIEINNDYRKFADVIIFCTGYFYTFPFLDPQCDIKVVDNHVTPLYKQVFNITYPSLSFVGLNLQILPCAYFYVQSQWITSILTGRKILPNSTDMMTDNQNEYQIRLNEGLREKDMHQLGVSRLESYCQEISQLAGVDKLPPYFFSIYYHCNEIRKNNYSTFREKTYHITEDKQGFIIDKTI